MIRIAALNEESDEDSDSEEEVTKEALEQIALQQYSKALDLQRKGNVTDALQLLKDLLDTELLYDIKKPSPGEEITEPLFNLKYLCYKNVAAIQSSNGDIEAAIDSYCAASELDDTDVTLWYRLGYLCISAKRYHLALNSFQRGVKCNPRHWPCLDKIVTLLHGLGFYEDCIVAIHDALQLDSGYLRGIVYRRHIYKSFPYIRDYMKYINKKYVWSEKEDDMIDEMKATQLLNEADVIHKIYQEQQDAEEIKYVLPSLKLKKPITKLAWSSVGESLVDMHHFMTENCFSHACFIDISFEREVQEEVMEICEEPKKSESSESKCEDNNTDTEKNAENGSETENNDYSDKEKVTTDTEKVESDIEIAIVEPGPPQQQTEAKKASGRRRGSDLRFLQQWEWCTRRSGRKKVVVNDKNDNIYDTLRKMVPACLVPQLLEKKDNKREISPDVTDLDVMFDETGNKKESAQNEQYFGTEVEQKEVELFINKYEESKRDIIEIMYDFLTILSRKWNLKWPEKLPKIYVEVNKCYSTHIDVPSCKEYHKKHLIHYVFVNILSEEFVINEKFNSSKDNITHDLSISEAIGYSLTSQPEFFATDCLLLMLRYLWNKLHIHLINKNDDFALDCLYQLSYEFQAMGDCEDTFDLHLINFSFKPHINKSEISAYVKFLERNKQLSTVMDLYKRGSYEEVLSIVIDSFEHCKDLARKQEEEMSLDFAVQLTLILDVYWALEKVEECFKWSFICLHESLKHFFHYTSGCSEYEKWGLAVIKTLCCMEHILSIEGLTCLDAISPQDLSQGLEDLIRVIGHQVETTATDMPCDSVIPWIIMHYILQREEDQGRGKTICDNEKGTSDDVPNPLMVLFIGHEQLGNRGWCCKSEGKLLYFILDTVVPRLRSPSLSKCLEQVLQYMEQCVYCLFSHPAKKNKNKYLEDHSAPPHSLNWHRAQQIYEIFRPLQLPELQGKVTAITLETEQLFQRIIALLPPECELQKYLPDLEKYMTGKENKLPNVPLLIPHKMKDIYFLLGDYHFKKEDVRLSIKYNMLDVLINNNRFESWAQLTLAKGVNLERMLNSCNNINNEKDFMRPAKTIIRCFKRTLDLKSNCDIWIEYGVFSYAVHSFCSRLLKQASESLSMEDFESLEKQKDEMLDNAQKCFSTVTQELKNNPDPDKVHEGMWLSYYLLGKVSEKRNKPPHVYLENYFKSVKSLYEADAIYPSKINYNSPQHYSIEVLEMQYRIHASILKYIEQHENKAIPASVGKVFLSSIEKWKEGHFSRKAKKNATSEDNDTKPADNVPQAANILKRSVSDAGEEDTHEAKKIKMESAAAKIRRSASYDTERIISKDKKQSAEQAISTNVLPIMEINDEKQTECTEETNQALAMEENNKTEIDATNKTETSGQEVIQVKSAPESILASIIQGTISVSKIEDTIPVSKIEDTIPVSKIQDTIPDQPPIEDLPTNKDDSSSSTSSTSTSGSCSSDTSSESSSDCSRDSESSKSSNDNRSLTDEEILNIISSCLEALEDCVSRFPLHYKALYRIAHYHFYYKKGKDIERCRDVMLSSFTSKLNGSKMGGLFGERKTSNFFNNIWRIPITEIDRPGGFANHMNRCVLLTMEILKEIDDHKTLLDISLQLQRIPDSDKKYLRDSDRDDLAQQSLSLCVQSLRGQLLKFSQQADLRSNDVEKKAFNSLMLDIYRAYQRVQKQPSSKQFTNLLVDGYKLVTTITITENTNLVDLSMKYCQSLIGALKQQATLATLEKNQNAQRKQMIKSLENTKALTASTLPTCSAQPRAVEQSKASTTSGLPKMSTKDITAAFQNYNPILNDSILSQQTADALSLSYLRNITALAGYTALQNSLHSSLQSSLQNSFQAEFYRQFLGQSFPTFNLPPNKKQKKSTNKLAVTKSVPASVSSLSSLPKPASKTFSGSISHSSVSKLASSVVTTVHKTTSAPLTPSMGTVLSTLPASLTVGLTTSYAQSSMSSTSLSQALPAHMSSSTTVSAAIHTKPPLPHQQVSPGKTLQEKLAERQKNLPAVSKPSIPTSREISASLGRLPSSLTITKSSVPKPPVTQGRKSEIKKSLFLNENQPKPSLSSNEVIVLDDDD